jgi:predicted P-loop ATPase
MITSQNWISDKNISFYKNCTQKISSSISIEDVFDMIENNEQLKVQIGKIRSTSNKAEIDNLKKNLPAVSISGLFENNRKADELTKHSGLIQIDIDKPENRQALISKLKEDQFSLAVFDSPTHTGIKVIVRIEADTSTHLQSFYSLEKYYLQNYEIQIDNKCKDLSRLMFLSYDENIFINYDSTIWLSQIDDKQSFEHMLNWLEKKKNEYYVDGNRNAFIYKLASACYRIGVSEHYALTECLNRFIDETFSETEIKTTVKSAYNGNLVTISNTVSKKGKSHNKLNKSDKNDKSFTQMARVENYIKSRYELRFNEVSLDVEFRKVGTKDPFVILNENDLYRELHLNDIKFSMSNIYILLGSKFLEPYNPFLEYLENLMLVERPNEIDYILKLSSYVPVTDRIRFEKHFKKMFVRTIACGIDNKVFNKHAFVLVHAEQSSGKSSFLRWLCPEPLKAYYTENMSTDKDSDIALTQNLFINLDELASLERKEINKFKSMFSSITVKVRHPFARRPVPKPRRASFFGSTNKDEFLTDETGSVRFLCFGLTGKINFAYSEDVSIDDVWYQAYKLYKSGFHYQLTFDDIVENELANRHFQIQTPEMQLIQNKYISISKDDVEAMFMNATDILKELTYENPHIIINSTGIGKALKLLGFKQETNYKKEIGYSLKGYFLKKI